MSDLRNFSGSKEPVIISEKIPETNFSATNLGSQAKFRDTKFQDTGGLSNFHHPVEEEKTNSNTARMIGGAVVVLANQGAERDVTLIQANGRAAGVHLPADSLVTLIGRMGA